MNLKKIALIGTAVACVAWGGLVVREVIVPGPVHPPAPTSTVPGENYQICDANSSYLTSPWTYDALGSGTATYTVSQYEALSGYGTTLPPLPSYISSQSGSTEAAEIFAPGANVSIPGFDTPEGPILFYFEGGDYSDLSLATTNGDEIIGGSASGFPQPVFNDSYQTNGGIDASDASSYGSPSTLADIAGSSTLTVGTTSFTLTSSRLPIVPGEVLTIGSAFYTVASVSGPQSGYTITLQSDSPIATSTTVGTAVTYNAEFSGDVTVKYLNISEDLSSGGTILSGADWTIENNDIHDGYKVSNVGGGTAIYDAADDAITSASLDLPYNYAYFHGGTIEYNCLENEGHSGIHEFGYSSLFEYNEIKDTPANASDNGGDAGDKWWGTVNSQILNNSFVLDGLDDTGSPIWFDNGNTGFLVQGNYFEYSYTSSVDVETGFNGEITDNLFLDGGWGDAGNYVNSNGQIEINQTGAWPISGSDYNNEILITDNTLTDDWADILIWGSGSRSCSNPQEQGGTSPWNNSPYCSGGYPNGDNQFSSYNYPNGNGQLFGTLSAGASSGATTISVNYYGNTPTVGDYIGFTGVGSSGYPNTTTTSTAAVTSFTGSQTLAVASTTGFPTSGQIQTATSASNHEGTVVGATFNYNGVSGGNLEDVDLIQGSGTLVNGGYVQAFEPYKITGVSGYAPYQQVTISPGLSSSESSGADIYSDGTCYDDLTTGSTPTSPTAPDGYSYFDGCMWEQRNITISGNTENFNPSDITSGPNNWGSTAYQSCTSGSQTTSCGVNFQQYQEGWSFGGPYQTYGYEMMNAFASSSNFMTPINSTWNGVPAGNAGEGAWDITWSDNTYNGPIYFYTYSYGTCAAPSPYNCFVNAATWTGTGTGDWHQG